MVAVGTSMSSRWCFLSQVVVPPAIDAKSRAMADELLKKQKGGFMGRAMGTKMSYVTKMSLICLKPESQADYTPENLHDNGKTTS